MTLTETPVSTFAKSKGIPLLEFESLPLARPDFLVVAGFGKKITNDWLSLPKKLAINMHPSLLPQYRGAFPAEWAILRGENKTGVTLLKMTESIDQGDILAQKEITIAPEDTRETLYDKLYRLGAHLVIDELRDPHEPQPQPKGTYFYARRLTREDGFVPWEKFDIHSKELEIKHRALIGWPGVWTTLPNGKRLKLIALKPKPIVQIEGKTPISFFHLKTDL
jgi:methionyl-tRNA formyltransferase